ncbi:MAG: ROK family protein [Bacteroidetes bacterium]|nr:ROK family protein [Bacteroidota bacterium]
MTLDAGGTNFVFNAVQNGEEVIAPVILPASAATLEKVLRQIIDGFRQVETQLSEKPVAISFAFPGPADYTRGIIGDLENLPLFRGGVALGPMLEETFGIPVFINNDGDLFAYGEAIAGLLKEVNDELGKRHIRQRYQNLLGVTLGTGFGAGMISGGVLFTGDNSAAAEINRMRSYHFPNTSIEDCVSIRGIRRAYATEAKIPPEQAPEPKEIFLIARGEKPGNQQAALLAYEKFATAAGDAILNALTMTDGLVVIGGGLSGASPLFLPKLVDYLKKPYVSVEGKPFSRMEIDVYNLDDDNDREQFFRMEEQEISVPFCNRKVVCYPAKKTGIGISRLGTSRAVSVGAYAFALSRL